VSVPAGSTIVLSGGRIDFRELPIATNQSSAMIAVNGKPVIAWILDDLLTKGIRDVVVVGRAGDDALARFLAWAYAPRMHLEFVPVVDSPSILHSLRAGLSMRQSGPVRIILGDTLITDSFDSTEDFAYTGDVEDSRRWCLVESDGDGRITRLADKQGHRHQPVTALAGYYHLLDGDCVRQCVDESIDAGNRELSRFLDRYRERRPIFARPATGWFDFGHLDRLVSARRRLLRPRSFNRLQIDAVLGTIEKRSDHGSKLRDELDWYLELPEPLRVLAPRILSIDDAGGELRFTQEYYGYPTLADLYVYADLSPEIWLSILRMVLNVHRAFRAHAAPLQANDVRSMYVDKTWERLATTRKDAGWAGLLDCDELQYNGQVLRGLAALRPALEARVADLAATARGSVIHGDFCFSNILFDLNAQILRVIDPRGRFGRKGVHGDPRYDVAKLRHSVCGLYDFIVADLMELTGRDGEFVGSIHAHDVAREIGSLFDGLLVNEGYDAAEIRLIEGLLFLSMIPLHADHPQRQRMMYFTGLQRLNEAL
jgi:dTDP-glucose pyrophosphorylase/aminoglycoside phosphotransferase